MASLGWAGPVPEGKRAQGRSPVPTWLSEECTFRHDLRAQAPVPSRRRPCMNFYTKQHAFYCGVDLHARTLYLCILSQAGDKVLHREVPAEPAAFLDAVAPYRQGLVVAAE